jgi:hypothetical protein
MDTRLRIRGVNRKVPPSGGLHPGWAREERFAALTIGGPGPASGPARGRFGLPLPVRTRDPSP